ncbi:prohibitin family protein, partial [Desulfobacterales bacterium HSG17]|nr:prohibitin family protein [Desulfobacterales bacterium HSG17]
MAKVYKNFKEHLAVLFTFSLIMLIILLTLFNRIVYFIEPGEGGVLYRLFFGGTVTTRVYTEGIQFIWPWDTMYIYNARVQEYPHDFDVLTVNGLKVHLSLSIRYRPEYKLIAILHQQVGEDYVNIVVIPEIENVLRVLIGRLNAEEVYTTKQSLIEKAISEAIEQIAQRYVNVDNVIIKRMKLPDSVDISITEKMAEKHKAEAYQFKLVREEREKERKRIEAEGLERFRKSLSPEVLQYMGIQATLELAQSNNSKVIVMGGGMNGGLPIIGNLPLAPFTELINTDPPETAEVSDKGESKDSGTEKTEPSSTAAQTEEKLDIK